MRLAAVALALLIIAAVGCDDDDASLAPNDARALRAFFTSHGFNQDDVTCVIDELTNRIGADQAADFAHGNIEGSDEEEETGTELAKSVVECGGINPEYTICYGIFESRADARDAAEQASSAGFDDAEVGIGGNPPRRPVPAVEFLSGKTDAAAGQIQNGFPRFIERMGGKLGHKGNGCLEQPFFGA